MGTGANSHLSPVFSWFCCFLPAKFIVVCCCCCCCFSLLVTRASSLMFRLLSMMHECCCDSLECEFMWAGHVNPCCVAQWHYDAVYMCVKSYAVLIPAKYLTRVNPSVFRASISLQVHFQNECYFEWEWQRIVGNVVFCLVSVNRNNQIILQALNMWSCDNRNIFGRRFGEENGRLVM